MARVHADRVQETTTTTGTGPLALAGAPDGSWRTFASVCSIGDTCSVCVADPTNGDFETGLYTYSDDDELTRTDIEASSNGGAAVDFQAGTKFVFATPIAAMFPAGLAGFAATGAIATSGITIATARLAGRTTASTGALEEISVSGGLGLSAGALTITDVELIALAGLTSAADKLPYFTGSGAAALADFTAGGRSLVNSAGTANTFPYFSSSNTVTLGSLSAGGLALANITGTADRVPWFSATNTAGLITVSAAGRSMMNATGTSGAVPFWSSTNTYGEITSSAGGRALMGVAGTSDRVPYFSATATAGLITVTASGRALMGIAGTADRYPYLSASDTWSLGTLTAFIRGLLDDTDAATARTTLGIAGKQAVWIPASAMVSRTTNGAGAGTVEMSTNKNMFATFDFDTTTQEFVQFMWCMPSSWDEGAVTFIPVWSHPSTTTNFGVVFQLAGVAISNDDAGDVAFGTAQTSADTGGTTNDIYKGPESSAITIAGTPAAGDYVMFQVARVPANGSDTMAVDARLHGIVLFITTNDTTDN